VALLKERADLKLIQRAVGCPKEDVGRPKEDVGRPKEAAALARRSTQGGLAGLLYRREFNSFCRRCFATRILDFAVPSGMCS
jgi:hypothetical protein